MQDRGADLSRRGFLTTSLAGLVAAGLGSVSTRDARAQEASDLWPARRNETIHRELGRTKLKLPIVNMGVMNSSNPEIVQASYELGVRHFDTAARYQFGRNEQMVGDVIHRLGVRDKVIIATKVLYDEQRTALDAGSGKEACISALESSLLRLKMDYVDILYIHSLHGAEEMRAPCMAGIKEGLAQLKRQGKARFVGVTTHEGMAEVINEAAAEGFFDVVLTAINVTMADDTALLTAIADAAKQGIGIVAMKTQAGGQRFPNPAAPREHSSATVATACLKWVLRHKFITTAIPGYTSFQHMREDFGVASNLEYSPEERKLLEDSDIELSLGFCRQCRSCLASCPHRNDLPMLIRTHMYAAQYGNFAEARTTLQRIPVDRGLKNCVSCSTCTARCARAVDIPRRIEELKQIYA